MKTSRTIHTEIGAYVSSLLRNSFGKGPTSIYVTISQPFIVIHFRGFITSMEKILLKQNETQRVLETRDLLMNDLRKEIIREFRTIGGLSVEEVYADWNLENRTGVIIGVTDDPADEGVEDWPEDTDRQAFRQKLIRSSIIAEKKADRLQTFWLDHRTILVRRFGILTPIEKALLKKGVTEELRLAKRDLEQEALDDMDLEQDLNQSISEIFLDWNFDADVGYVVFVLNPKK
ncbi:DUF2294 domain-containing protein [Planococcus lenghuensis]|uniref:Na+-translocating membrane potential-generating system MpsC domain-containing protein n=1 Tax=Planococcus lenghuensis TaxID=2213202 RepID=A0A1Q2KVZ2_9BACL|nr:Na-translocating system protein MpsC family protein [Planococcus lenghuensis]AQQ52370.1 hypothetical protein B0X71_04075 [Planococcus lenghuensis]